VIAIVHEADDNQEADDEGSPSPHVPDIISRIQHSMKAVAAPPQSKALRAKRDRPFRAPQAHFGVRRRQPPLSEFASGSNLASRRTRLHGRSKQCEPSS
jgi:hypothetical protein